MKPFAAILFLALLFTACTADRNGIRIDLRNRQLDHLPDSIFLLRNVTVLEAGPGWVAAGPLGDAQVTGANQLQTLPDRLCQLSRLRRLGLSHNQLHMLPGCLAELRRLESLDLSFNRDLDIHQALPLILQLPNLKELNLCGIVSVYADSAWVKDQFRDKRILLSITMQDLVKNYSRRQ